MHRGVFLFFFNEGLFKSNRKKKGWKKFSHFIYGRSVSNADPTSSKKA